MAEFAFPFVPENQKTCTVRVSSYENRELKGTLFCPGAGAERSFSSLVELLLAIGNWMDSVNYPQKATEVRAFRPVPDPDLEDASFSGLPLATFHIKIMFRQNSSWQGSISWINQGCEAFFRSVYELILIMDSALMA